MRTLIVFNSLLQIVYAVLNVTEYLRNYGDINSLTNFQDFYHLEVNGKANEETLLLMNKPRCGESDFVLIEKSGEISFDLVLCINISRNVRSSQEGFRYLATGP